MAYKLTAGETAREGSLMRVKKENLLMALTVLAQLAAIAGFVYALINRMG